MSNTYAPCPRCEAINRVPINRAEAEAPVCGRCKTALPVEHGIVEVSGTSLQHLIDHMQLPILTDFWAPWCVPCRTFKIEYQRAATIMADRMIFTSLNSMENTIAADVHRVRTLPTLIVFQNGSELDRRFGAVSGETLVNWLKSVLGEAPMDRAA